MPLQLTTAPLAPEASMLRGDRCRITVLTPSLLRLEYAPDGVFEDRPTQSVLCRDFPTPACRVIRDGDAVKVFTEYLEITWDGRPFTPGGLTVKVNDPKGFSGTWHYGQVPEDLGGTARTLDMTDGDRVLNSRYFATGGAPGVDYYCGHVQLGPGVISRRGFSVLDDSRSMVLTEDGWIAPRKDGGADLYFFGYGSRYLDALRDFYHLCGHTPLLPRYAFGNWWSRYHRYTDPEYRELVTRFEREEVPFSVAVVDMDWHLVDDVDPKYGTGWTGYTWNRHFFPDPEAFMRWLHGHGLKITLNVHPADGIRAYEELYLRVAEAMGVDPASELPIVFDPADPKFMEVYLKVLHHALEEQGVDFWWIDWQQGEVTSQPGLDPLWILNHFHFLDSGWKGRRAMTFSRYAGIGSHRYPVGFSGDTVISWDSLRYQPYFTNTASNIGYGWWSHDIGGHMMGGRDDELMARWVQYGVFSPINRLHSTDNEFSGKEPWKFDRDTCSVMKTFLRLRHGLIPYLYTMNRRAAREDLPLIWPMYYREPDRPEAYQVPNAYYFGTELLVSPITEPRDPVARVAGAKTWLPEGLWADFFNGRVYTGGRMLTLYRSIDEMPVLMKAGAIVPLKDMTVFDNSTDNPEALEVRIFPATNGAFTLWEDTGDAPEQQEVWAATAMRFDAAERTFTISGAEGALSVLPPRRRWRLVFAGVGDTPVEVRVDGAALPVRTSWDEKTHFLTVTIPETDITRCITVRFTEEGYRADNPVVPSVYAFLEKAQISYDLKAAILRHVRQGGTSGALFAMDLPEVVLGALLELLDA